MKAPSVLPYPSFLVPVLSEPSFSPTAGTGDDGTTPQASKDARSGSTGRDLVPVEPRLPPVVRERPAEPPEAVDPARPRTPLEYIAQRVDIRAISPREMQDLALDLYAVGALAYDDYALLAFQPELHPDFAKTIGALTGEAAAPDKPRDYLMKWEQRLLFEQRHNPGDHYRVKQSTRIVGLLRRLNGGVDTAA